jgi:hypothetical protein
MADTVQTEPIQPPLVLELEIEELEPRAVSAIKPGPMAANAATLIVLAHS